MRPGDAPHCGAAGLPPGDGGHRGADGPAAHRPGAARDRPLRREAGPGIFRRRARAGVAPGVRRPGRPRHGAARDGGLPGLALADPRGDALYRRCFFQHFFF